MVSVSGLTPCVRSASATSSAFTNPRSTRISPRRLPVFFCSTSASSSCGVVSFFVRMRTSPRRSLLFCRVASSSCIFWGALLQNSCLYFSLAAQKQRKQNGHSFVGFFGSSEHQTAFRASNSPRQFQHVVGKVSTGTRRGPFEGGGVDKL